MRISKLTFAMTFVFFLAGVVNADPLNEVLNTKEYARIAAQSARGKILLPSNINPDSPYAQLFKGGESANKVWGWLGTPKGYYCKDIKILARKDLIITKRKCRYQAEDILTSVYIPAPNAIDSVKLKLMSEINRLYPPERISKSESSFVFTDNTIPQAREFEIDEKKSVVLIEAPREIRIETEAPKSYIAEYVNSLDINRFIKKINEEVSR